MSNNYLNKDGEFLDGSIIAEFTLETEIRLRRGTRIQTENSSDMNPVKDEFTVSNLYIRSLSRLKRFLNFRKIRSQIC